MSFNVENIENIISNNYNEYLFSTQITNLTGPTGPIGPTGTIDYNDIIPSSGNLIISPVNNQVEIINYNTVRSIPNTSNNLFPGLNFNGSVNYFRPLPTIFQIKSSFRATDNGTCIAGFSYFSKDIIGKATVNFGVCLSYGNLFLVNDSIINTELIGTYNSNDMFNISLTPSEDNILIFTIRKNNIQILSKSIIIIKKLLFFRISFVTQQSTEFIYVNLTNDINPINSLKLTEPITVDNISNTASATTDIWQINTDSEIGGIYTTYSPISIKTDGIKMISNNSEFEVSNDGFFVNPINNLTLSPNYSLLYYDSTTYEILIVNNSNPQTWWDFTYGLLAPQYGTKFYATIGIVSLVAFLFYWYPILGSLYKLAPIITGLTTNIFGVYTKISTNATLFQAFATNEDFKKLGVAAFQGITDNAKVLTKFSYFFKPFNNILSNIHLSNATLTLMNGSLGIFTMIGGALAPFTFGLSVAIPLIAGLIGTSYQIYKGINSKVRTSGMMMAEHMQAEQALITGRTLLYKSLVNAVLVPTESSLRLIKSICAGLGDNSEISLMFGTMLSNVIDIKRVIGLPALQVIASTLTSDSVINAIKFFSSNAILTYIFGNLITVGATFLLAAFGYSLTVLASLTVIVGHKILAGVRALGSSVIGNGHNVQEGSLTVVGNNNGGESGTYVNPEYVNATASEDL